MTPMVPTDLPSSTTHTIALHTLQTLNQNVSKLLTQITSKLDAQIDETDALSTHLQQLEQKMIKTTEGDGEFTYSCLNSFPTSDGVWDVDPLFESEGSATRQGVLSSEEAVVVNQYLLKNWEKNDNLDSGDLYNFYLGVQLETLDKRSSNVRLMSPLEYQSFNSLTELRYKTSEYLKIVEPEEVAHDIFEDAQTSQYHSEKQSVGFSTTMTQSSLLSNGSATRSSVLKKRRDVRRKQLQHQPKSPVANLLRNKHYRNFRSSSANSNSNSRSPLIETFKCGIEEEDDAGITDSYTQSFTEGMSRSPSWKILGVASNGSQNGNGNIAYLCDRAQSLSKAHFTLQRKS